MSDLLTDEIRALPRSGKSMSNFDRAIDPGMEEDLRNGMAASYYGRNFCCDYVWLDGDQFRAAVFVYGALSSVESAPTLEELMTEVSERYGYE